MKHNNKGLLNFIVDNAICWVVVLVASIALHASMLFGKALGIDTEAIMYFGRDFYGGWTNTGRQGLVLAKYVLFSLDFNPIVSGVLTIIFLLIAVICWTYMFHMAAGGRSGKVQNIIFSLLLVSHTILTEQVYFRIQSAELALGFALLAVSVSIQLWIMREAHKSSTKVCFWILSALINLWIFGIYQSMLPLYILTVAAIMYLHCVVRYEYDGICEAHPWLMSIKFAGLFILTFAVNEAITLKYFTGSAYLSNQIYWGTEPIGVCLRNIASHIARAGILGRRVYFVPSYIVYVILMLLITNLYLKKITSNTKLSTQTLSPKKISSLSRSFAIYTYILFIFLAGAPFYMTIICGGESVIRSQLNLPFAIAIMGYLLVGACTRVVNVENRDVFSRILVILIVVVNLFTIAEQATCTVLLDYTDKVRYAQDEELALKMIDDISGYQDEDNSLPVAFVGRRPAELNKYCVKTGDMVGASFFDWDTDPEPYSYHSSLRIIGFLSTLGTTYTEPAAETMDEYVTYAEANMTDYPAEGSICKKDGVVIVRLSGR